MKTYFFIRTAVFSLFIFGFCSFSLASIIIYNSQGGKTEINSDFPSASEKLLDFTTTDANQKQVHIDSIISFLTSFENFPFKLTQNSIHSVRFNSIRSLGGNTFTLRFSYDLDLSKMNHLLPNKVSFISKNILVRVKDGHVESIATGIENDVGSIVYNKIKSFTYIQLKKQQQFESEQIKSTIKNLIDFLKEESSHYKLLAQLLLKNKTQFLLHLKQLIQQIRITPNQSMPKLLSDAYHVFSSMASCKDNCSQSTIEFNHFFKNLGVNQEIEKIMKEWIFSDISKMNFMEFMFNELLSKKSSYFHLDAKNNLHLIVQLNGAEPLKIDLMMGIEGIEFKKFRMESHFNDLKLIETKKMTSTIYSNNYEAKTDVVSFDHFEYLLERKNKGLLDSDQDYISLNLLNNLKYYKEHLMFERKMANKPIVIHYGINEPASKAENASWAYFPIEKFFIGSGGQKFSGLGKQADILGHEFFHFAEESLSNLYSSNESGALKEHGGDILGMIVSENMNKTIDDKPAFAMGCNIFTREAIEANKTENRQFKVDQNLELDKICLRNYLQPTSSFSPQASSKKSIQRMLGDHYQTECEDSPDNDSCGLHFQVAIPNLVVSQFMVDAKKNFPSLKWSEIRDLTAKILFNTFAGRLQSDAGFLTYAKQLKLECLEQSTELTPLQNASALCNQLEGHFIEILK